MYEGTSYWICNNNIFRCSEYEESLQELIRGLVEVRKEFNVAARSAITSLIRDLRDIRKDVVILGKFPTCYTDFN